ncbi:MAG: FKBP-type peptidyl-prolyl cis-trans isomerase [Pseudomonadota bacterium]
MKILLQTLCALALGIALVACEQPGESGESTPAAGDSEVLLDTPDKRLSYGVALGLGRNMRSDGMEMDIAAFTAGLADAMSDAEPKMTEDEIRSEMVAFQQRLNEQRQAASSAIAAENSAAAEAFLADNAARDGVVTTDSGLQYEVVTEGDGASPGPADRVSVHYRGTLIDGTVFDSSYDRGEPVEFGVTQVIAGWTEALQLMKVGSKYKLAIPSDLAYGAGGAGDRIGPNAALIFEVELLGIPSQEASADSDDPSS